MASSVPKRIFQTWETDDVPERWRSAQQSVRLQNPDFHYTLLTDHDRRDILRKHWPQLLPILRDYPHAVQRADLIRYVVMYLFGGVYLDLDYVCLRPLAGLVERVSAAVGLVPSTNSPNYVSNSVLISRPGASFWLEVIHNACKQPPWWAITRHAQVSAPPDL